jgi:hypothetical protein
MRHLLFTFFIFFCGAVLPAQDVSGPESDTAKAVPPADTAAAPAVSDTVAAPAAPDTPAAPAVSDTVAAPAASDSASQPPDSAAAAQAPDSARVDTVAPKPEPPKPGPRKIVRDKKAGPKEDIDVIKTYSGDVNKLKSPKKAFFLSFILPGLGEFYSKSHWARYSAPFAVELGCYVSIFVIRANYNDLVRDYEKFADAHYSHARFKKFYDFIQDTSYNDPTMFLSWEIDPFSHATVYFEEQKKKSNDYYEMIGKYDEFAQGWEDIKPDMVKDSFAYIYGQAFGTDHDYRFRGFAIEGVAPNTDGTVDTNWMYYHDVDKGVPRPRYFGRSASQLKYMDLREDANDMARNVKFSFYTMIINRIISAVDAVLAANAYNRRITHGSLTHFERIRVRPAHIGDVPNMTNGCVLTYSF